MPTALTQPLQFGLARDPVEVHRQFAFFEGGAGMRRIAQRRDRARQCEAKGGGAEQRPAAKIRATSQTSIWFLPPSPKTEQRQRPRFNAT